MNVTAFGIAERFIGIREVPGSEHNPHVLAMLRLDQAWPKGDETPWCSAFVNYVAWVLRLPRSKSLRARSWLNVGTPVRLLQAKPEFDVVILKRGSGRGRLGPTVLDAPGHVGFFAGLDDSHRVFLLGGNQGNTVSLRPYPTSQILGVRRLYDR